MVDFVKLKATAQRLIAANGRAVTFIQHDQTLSDPAKPWKGPADPRATPASTSNQVAVFVEPFSATELGLSSIQTDLIKRSDQIMIVAAGVVDLSQFQEVLDDGVYWIITGIETLRPGTTTLLFFVGVRR